MRALNEAFALLLCGSALLGSSAVSAKDGVKTGKDGVTLTAADGALRLTVGGRLHFDALRYDNSVFKLEDADIRRARIEVSGRVGGIVHFRADREFARSPGWRNLWVSIRPSDMIEIKAGNYSTPFAMEELQSSNRIALIERSLLTALTPSYGLGIGVRLAQRHWTLSGGYFDDAIADEDGPAEERGKGLSGRATLAPVNRRGKLVHLGVAAERRSFSSGETASFSTRSGSALAPTLLATGRIRDPDHLTSLGADAALARGSFLLQGQYVATRLTRQRRSPLDFDGWYAQASWIVSGERYSYSRHAGIVSGVNLRRGRTAVELAARYSELDLSDGSFEQGQGTALTLGANWYLSENVRLMANYVRSEAHGDPAQGDGAADLIAARLQTSF